MTSIRIKDMRVTINDAYSFYREAEGKIAFVSRFNRKQFNTLKKVWLFNKIAETRHKNMKISNNYNFFGFRKGNK